MTLRLITAPDAEPLSLTDDIKPHLRIDFDDDDPYLEALLLGARQHVETAELSGALITQTWELVLDNFPSLPLELPRPPLQSVTSITYIDIDDSSNVYPSSSYRVSTDSWPGQIVLKQSQTWPSVVLREIEGVIIRFVAGYGDTPESLPMPIRQAMLLIVGDWYENRENSPLIPGVSQAAKLPFVARALLSSYRNRRF